MDESIERASFIGKVVSCESPLMILALFPSFHIIKEYSDFINHPFIYKGSPISPKILERLRSLNIPFIVYTSYGGDISLTRDILFNLMSSRKRVYRQEFDSINIGNFVNIVSIMKISNKLHYSQMDNSVYPIFEDIATSSVYALDKAFKFIETNNPNLLLSSLITFYGKISTHKKGSSLNKSGHYQMLIDRASRKAPLYTKSLADLTDLSSFSVKLQIVHLIISICHP